MANIGSAYLAIFPSMDGFAAKLTSELNGVNVSAIGDKMGDQIGDGISDGMGKAAKGTSGFSGKLSALSGIAMGVAGELAGRLFDAVVGLGSEMVEASDSAQKFASTLSFAGIDDSTIKQLTASTQEYADQTIYDLADIRNVTAQLASNGVDNYAQLAEAAGNLNAVAGGSADTFRSVSMVMSQTAGMGKLTTENWNQLAEAIPGASGALQQAMADAGAFEGNFREAMENGEVSADEFFAAVQKLGMQDVAIEAATSTSTIEGALGNLKASVVGVGSQLVTALNPAITGAMNVLTDVISGIPSLLSTYGPQLASFFSPLVTAAQTAWATLQPMLATIGTSFSSLVATLGPVVQALAGYFASWGATLMSIGTSIMSVLLPVLTQVVNFVTTQIMPVVVPVITQILTTVQTAFPLIQTAITTALTVIQTIWNTVWPALQAVVMPIVQGISSFISGAMTAIQGVINVVLGIINGDWSQVWTGIQQVAQGIWDGITGLVSGAINAVSSVISGVLGTISSVWNGIWSSVSSFVSDTWTKVTTAVSNGVQSVLDFVGSIPDKIMSFFSDAGSWLLDAGKSIIQGLIDGITGMIDGAVSAVTGVVDTIRSFFPFSPAKRGPFSGHGYTTYSGRALMTDFGDSIARAGASAVSAAMGVMSDVSAALRADGTAQLGVGAYGYGAAGAISGDTTGTTNVYIDGSLVAVDSRIAQALALLLDAAGRRRDMGGVTA